MRFFLIKVVGTMKSLENMPNVLIQDSNDTDWKTFDSYETSTSMNMSVKSEEDEIKVDTDYEVSDLLVDPEDENQDRKSTRLNSSH